MSCQNDLDKYVSRSIKQLFRSFKRVEIYVRMLVYMEKDEMANTLLFRQVVSVYVNMSGVVRLLRARSTHIRSSFSYNY